jgi:hypothetical protein
MNLARPFKAGKGQGLYSRRVATPETRGRIQSSLRDEKTAMDLIRALKRPAKFMPTLRVEDY